jgi:hypothetical protein
MLDKNKNVAYCQVKILRFKSVASILTLNYLLLVYCKNSCAEFIQDSVRTKEKKAVPVIRLQKLIGDD